MRSKRAGTLCCPPDYADRCSRVAACPDAVARRVFQQASATLIVLGRPRCRGNRLTPDRLIRRLFFTGRDWLRILTHEPLGALADSPAICFICSFICFFISVGVWFGEMGGNHPHVPIGVHQGSATVAPEHIHHGSLRLGPEFYRLGEHLVGIFGQQIQTRRRSTEVVLRCENPCAAFPAPTLKWCREVSVRHVWLCRPGHS